MATFSERLRSLDNGPREQKTMITVRMTRDERRRLAEAVGRLKSPFVVNPISISTNRFCIEAIMAAVEQVGV